MSTRAAIGPCAMISRRMFAGGLAAAVVTPSPLRAEGGPGIYIPAHVTTAGLMVSPDGQTTIVDLTTLPSNVDIPLLVGSPGSVVLDAGAFGTITALSSRYGLLTGTRVTIRRSHLHMFAVNGPCVAGPALPPRDRRLLLFGQSLASMWGDTSAFAAFQGRRRELGDMSTTGLCLQATGGSAALKRYVSRAMPGAYWWDEETKTPGPLLVPLLAALKALPRAESPTDILWVQGERDSSVYRGRGPADDAAFVTAYADAVTRILAFVRAALGAPRLPVYLQRLGPRLDATTGKASMTALPGMDLVRQAQARVVARGGGTIRWGAQPDTAVPLRDVVHPTEWGAELIGAATAEAMAV